MKFLNFRKIITLPKAFSGKFITYDSKGKSFTSNSDSIEETFKNKTLLVIYPYPSKGRLNSALSDDILTKLNLGKEILSKENNSEDSDSNFREIFKLKYKNNLDEVVGISELDEKDTIDFIKKNKISNVSFLIDPKNSFNKTNFLDSRYEMILENLSILEYRKDPNNLDNGIYVFFSLYFFIFFLLCLLSSYYILLIQYGENVRMERYLKKTIEYNSYI